MKILTTTLLLFVGMRLACWADPIDPSESVYQLDWGTMPPGNMWFGGGWSERDQIKSETPQEQELRIKLENMALTAARGRKLMSQGISAIVLGIMLVFFLKQYHLQWVGLAVSGFGVWRFATGLIEIKLAENWQVVTGSLVFAAIIFGAGVMLWNSGIDFTLLRGKFKNAIKRIVK